MVKKNISRRKFIGTTSCAAIGYSTLFSTLINLKAFNAAAISQFSAYDPADYKALVCLFQSGGNDSFNMLMPKSDAEYGVYATTRATAAIPQNESLALNGSFGGVDFGVHPGMSDVQQLFNSDKLAFITNIGTLVQPTTKEQFFDGSVPLPLGLMSHADQIQQWQTGRPHERGAIGWGGRISDLINSLNSNDKIEMNISLSGTNILQSGNNSSLFTIDAEGAASVEGYGNTEEPSLKDILVTASVDSLFDYNYQDIFKQTYANVTKRALEGSFEFQEAINNVGEFSTTFSENGLSQQFKMIAKAISIGDAMGFKRQIFFVEHPGWDHHDDVLMNQAAMLPEISVALGEFNAVMEELGMADSVTAFTVSEFGRSLTSNGNGTDHGWGGNVMVTGGAVNGGQLFGTYPSLALESDLDVGGGVIIPTTPVDLYLAELAKWFGVGNADLNMIFPNLSNFFDTGSGDLPLGFLNI